MRVILVHCINCINSINLIQRNNFETQYNVFKASIRYPVHVCDKGVYFVVHVMLEVILYKLTIVFNSFIRYY